MRRRPNLVLKELREHLALNQEDFGKRLGRTKRIPVTQGSISQIERGSRGISNALVLRVAERLSPEMLELGITTTDLLRGERAPIIPAAGSHP